MNLLHAAAEARLNHSADAQMLMARYAEATGIPITEADHHVREYLDDCLSR